MAGQPVLRARGVRKTYRLGRVNVPVLRGVDLDVAAGEMLAILGKSGSGKSTLLHLMGGLDRPDAGVGGEITFDERSIRSMSARELNDYRCSTIGFVFQFYHLLPELTVMNNVCLAAMVRWGRLGYASRRAAVEARAADLLTAFGLGDRLKHRPAELSGGERQRVAIARALINEPRVLLADEPTGNLDRATGSQILDLLADHQCRTGLTMVLVTHDNEVAARAGRSVRLVDGVVAV
jgi:lipoprotein-releasing system ATP-binding protein